MSIFTLLLVFPLLVPLRPEPGSAPAPHADAMTEALAAFVGDDTFAGLEVGVSVRCADDPAQALLGHRADELMTPASGAKLLSTAAALSLLPVDHRFATLVTGELEAGRARELALIAGGDPALDAADLTRLAKALAAAGVRRVEGPIVVDLGHFAGDATPPAYDTKNTDAAYRPEVPALGVGSGAFTITVKAGKKVGDPVKVTTNPATASIVVENGAKTLDGKGIDKLVIEARAGAEGKTRVIVSGGLGQKAPNQGVRKRLADPATVAAELFVAALGGAGVEVTGKPRWRFGDAASHPELARVDSRPLGELVAVVNKTSNNYMAETLYKQLGAAKGPGRSGGDGATWARADEVATRALVGLGLTQGSFDVVNGSGLYAGTRVSPAAMTRLLAAMFAPSPTHDAFRQSLAVAGESGTLKGRLKKLRGKVSGKTGTLDDALSLSGYIESTRCPLAFSVIVNGPIGDRAGKVTARIDGFVSKLAAP